MTSVQGLFDLGGRVAIVTGGAGRIGSQMSAALAEASAQVIIASRRIENCRRKAAELGRVEGRVPAYALSVDVTQADSVRAMVSAVLERFGRIDVLVNAAHSGPLVPFEEMTPEQWRAGLEPPLTGTFLCSQVVTPIMVRQKRGAIINIGSIYGLVAPDRRIYGRTGLGSPCHYAAAKGGVIQLTRWLAAHLAPYNIRVNCISPGGFYNKEFRGLADYEDVFVRNYVGRTPLGRMGNDIDLKGAIVFLASEASSWVTGHNLVIDGGWTVW